MSRSKRPRLEHQTLQDLLHCGAVSTIGLATILKKVKDLENAQASRRQLRQANLESFTRVRHVEKVDMQDGTTWDWEFAHPSALLTMLVSENDSLAELYAEAARLYPCSAERPWTLIIGFDEFVPGAKLKAHNQRKCMNLSYTFLELGRDALWHEACWVTPVCVRHSKIAAAVGGWSEMLRRYLTLQLLGAQGLCTAGVPLVIKGEHFLLFAKLKYLLADMEGHKLALCAKGAAGMKPCIKHYNVLSKHSELAHRSASHTFVDVTCSDHSKFLCNQSSDIWSAVDALSLAADQVAGRTMTKTVFADLEKALGFKWQQKSLLLDMPLRRHVDIIEVVVFDWVHTALNDGTVTQDAFLLVQACGRIGVTMRDLELYMQTAWEFPKVVRTKHKSLHQVFQTCRAPNADKLKCSASELLGLYALLRHFVEMRIEGNPAVAHQVASYKAACKTIDIIIRAKKGLMPLRQAGRELRDAVSDHMQKHICAYGTDHIRPKHHYMYDVCDQLEKAPAVLDAFIVERLHLRMKAVADPIDNTSSFERSVLASLINTQSRILREGAFCCDGLKGRVGTLPGFVMQVADTIQLGGVEVAVDDKFSHQQAQPEYSLALAKIQICM